MAQADVSPYSAVESGPGPDFKGWGGPHLVPPGPHEDPLPGGMTERADVDQMTPHMGSVQTMLMRLRQQAPQRASTMNAARRILDDWRATERELAAVRESSPDWPRLQSRLDTLRRLYHRLFHDRHTGPFEP